MPDESAEARITLDITKAILPLDRVLKRKEREQINKDLECSSLLYGFLDVWHAFQGDGIKVAVLDTGIDVDHPAFPPQSLHSCVRFDNGRRTDGPDAVRDINGHGTHCAGIIAARPLHRDKSAEAYIPYEPEVTNATKIGGDDSADPRRSRRDVRWLAKGKHALPFDALDIRFSGIAPRVQLMIYKVTQEEVERGKLVDRGVAKVDDLASAIVDAVKREADIISISIQSDVGTQALYDAVHWALWRRKTVICSAGNRGMQQQVNIGYPAQYGGVITVAAVTRYGQPSGFTSVGGEVDVGAPGEDVWSTWKDSSYARQSGTSMAAPWVAGIAALLLSKHRKFARDNLKNETPIRNNEEMRQHILRMATHPGHYEPATGYGPLWPGDYLARETAF